MCLNPRSSVSRPSVQAQPSIEKKAAAPSRPGSPRGHLQSNSTCQSTVFTVISFLVCAISVEYFFHIFVGDTNTRFSHRQRDSPALLHLLSPQGDQQPHQSIGLHHLLGFLHRSVETLLGHKVGTHNTNTNVKAGLEASPKGIIEVYCILLTGWEEEGTKGIESWPITTTNDSYMGCP